MEIRRIHCQALEARGSPAPMYAASPFRLLPSVDAAVPVEMGALQMHRAFGEVPEGSWACHYWQCMLCKANDNQGLSTCHRCTAQASLELSPVAEQWARHTGILQRNLQEGEQLLMYISHFTCICASWVSTHCISLFAQLSEI